MRYRLLDNIRGFAIINMVLYHLCWDLVYIYGINLTWYGSNGAYIWQQCICWTFIFLSGYSWSLGTHQLKRGVTVSIAGIIVSIVTILFLPEDRVMFGVLTLIGASMLLLIPLDKWLKNLKPTVGLVVSVMLFVVTRNINQGSLGFYGWNIVKLDRSLYHGDIMTFLGFTDSSFFSTDYFSLMPWFFLFLAGYFLYKFTNRRIEQYFQTWPAFKPLEFIGRHSLIIYMLHQPVIYGCLMVIFGR